MSSLSLFTVYVADLLNEDAGVSFAELLTSSLTLKSLAVGTLISLCAAMLGVILVLKRYALIGHGLGEVGFAASAFAALIGLQNYSVLVSIPVVCASSVLIMRLDRKSELGGDVLIGIFSTAALAVGVIMTRYTTGLKSVYDTLFKGSVLSLSNGDVISACVLSVIIIAVFVLLYTRLFAVTFDETNARASGMNEDGYQLIISILTSVSVVLGMKVMGAMMISSFIIFPALSARRLARSFRGMIICSAVIAVVSYFAGTLISFITDLPNGACVVAASLVLMLICMAFSAVRLKK
ncbi:MAG: metal ABC transporter permease [Clostridia bacterium]|nr:metal ABC transporter permease [Clostridia bacterium]